MFGSGNVRIPLASLPDIARLAVRMLEDERTACQEVVIVLPDNVLSQRDLIRTWESISDTALTQKSARPKRLMRSLRRWPPIQSS